ncbi:MAG: TDP-N-acetylfucosamine:lipid II N-acetylfucosaminyltransferase [Candidatus Acinetobacter avistercoris]|nr:TDP-N-acetylfucosamine:lipid II N-acetylfucosaminyltransferase [Candidatus Acinetobacter avistercoris]
MEKTEKILHLSPDDKFVDMALSTFNTFGCVENDLVVYSRNKSLKFVKNKAFIIKNPRDIESLINNYDLIVVHSLAPIWGRLLLKANKNIPIIWIGWGYDYYDFINQNLYLKETKDLIGNLGYLNLIDLIRVRLTNLARKIFRMSSSFDLFELIERINYFSPVLESEYYMVKENLGNIKFPKYISFNYGNLENYFAKDLEYKRVTGYNILIGNSASYTSNHIDSFSLLMGIDIGNAKIICPLSYGDKKYSRYVENQGVKYFGESFKPLVNFMPLSEYIENISSCGYVIMNHCRQQAYGNIVTMLYLGAKVFLREENPLYSYLKSKGMHIFSIQELEKVKSLGERLEENIVLENRSILSLLLSKNTIENHVKKILKLAKT